LNSELHAFSRNILDEGCLISCHVLNWSLENLPIFRLLPLFPNWNILTYEALCLDPFACLSKLSSRLDLDPLNIMAESMKLPSMTTLDSRKSFIYQSSPMDKLNSWRSEIPPSKAQDLIDIPRRFGIDIYSSTTSLPDTSSLPLVSVI